MTGESARMAEWVNNAVRPYIKNVHFEPGPFGRTANWILVDCNNRLVARIRAVRERPFERTQTAMRTAAALAESGAPVIGPALKQAVSVGPGGSYYATIWPLGEDCLVTPSDMAGTIFALHKSDAAIDGPVWGDLVKSKARRTERRLGRLSGHIPGAAERFLRQRINTVLRSVLEAAGSGDAVQLHGDAHPRNFIRHNGSVAAVDLDDLCRGPREADLAPTVVHSRFYPGADPNSGDRLVQAYSSLSRVDMDLLGSIVELGGILRVADPGGRWFTEGINPKETAGIVVDRLSSYVRGVPFKSLHGTEALSPFKTE